MPFAIGFRVEVDPEFPGDGGDAPQRIPGRLPQIGAVLRISAPGVPDWEIAVGAPGWWRTPVPTAIAFVSDWTGFVVDVVERRVLHEVPGVARIREDEAHDLLLMTTGSDLVAIGAHGIRWRTEVAQDDLKVVAIDARGIVCTGYDGGELPSEFVLDPDTGRIR